MDKRIPSSNSDKGQNVLKFCKEALYIAILGLGIFINSSVQSFERLIDITGSRIFSSITHISIKDGYVFLPPFQVYLDEKPYTDAWGLGSVVMLTRIICWFFWSTVSA